MRQRRAYVSASDVQNPEALPLVRRPDGEHRLLDVGHLRGGVHEGEEDGELVAADADEDVPDEVSAGQTDAKPDAAEDAIAEPDSDGDEPEQQSASRNVLDPVVAATVCEVQRRQIWITRVSRCVFFLFFYFI